jgi:hypothetical protein
MQPIIHLIFIISTLIALVIQAQFIGYNGNLCGKAFSYEGAFLVVKKVSSVELTMLVTLIGEIGVLVGVITPVIISVKKIATGTKCQLRSEMLRIYYHNRQAGIIRQYEYENFVMLYEAYKALKGNSFIDRIYEEVKEWEIVS